MAKRYVGIAALAALLAAPPSPAVADDTRSEPLTELELLKKRIREIEDHLGTERQGTESEAEPLGDRLQVLEGEVDRLGYAQRTGASVLRGLEGIALGGGATTIAHGTAGNNDAFAGGNKVRANFSGDLALEVPIGPYGRAFTRALVGQGQGLSDVLPPVFSGPNADLEVDEDNVNLVEFWYEVRFPNPTVMDRRLSIALGKMDPTGSFDTNNVANDETQQFLADTFVNNLAIDWGGDENGYGLGTRVGWRFTSIYNQGFTVEGKVGLFAGEGDLSTAFSGPFVIGELDVSRRSYGLARNYRLYAWTNQADHVAFDQPDSKQKASWGWGVSLDQQVSGDATLFARYGWQDPSVGRFDHVITLGGQLVGNRWRRGGDILGLAAGYTHASKSYGGVSESLDGVGVTGGETYVEAYYSYLVDGGLRLSPDIQYIHRPGGIGGAKDRFLFGLRAQLNF